MTLFKNTHQVMEDMRRPTNFLIKISKSTWMLLIKKKSIIFRNKFYQKWNKYVWMRLKAFSLRYHLNGSNIISRYLGWISWLIVNSILGWYKLIPTHACNWPAHCWQELYLKWLIRLLDWLWMWYILHLAITPIL